MPVQTGDEWNAQTKKRNSDQSDKSVVKVNIFRSTSGFRFSHGFFRFSNIAETPLIKGRKFISKRIKNLMSIEPQLVTREATIELAARISRVFPLFEPLNEKLWIESWDPRIIYPSSGHATEDMIFITKPRFEGEPDYRWVLTRLDRSDYRIHYTVSTAERIWFIKVWCASEGNATRATIRYSYIGLTPDGHSRNLQAMEQIFRENLRDWERGLNSYLAFENSTG